jgi:hypothetical protein
MQHRTIRILSVSLFLGLLLWGGFSTLVYLGVPVHGAVYLTDAVQKSLQGLCDPSALLCRGVYTLVPMLLRTTGRAGPFLPYATVCALVAIGFLVLSAVKTGLVRFRFRLSALSLILLFVGSLWLHFTTQSLGSIGGVPLRRIIEPLPGVYQNVGEEGLAELQRNFDRLEDKGCLRPAGQFTNGAGVYQLSFLCTQQFFVTRVFFPFILILLFLFELLILGRMALRAARFSFDHPLAETVLCAGAGACLWIVVLWMLAVLHLFHIVAIGAVVVLVPAVGWRTAAYWLRKLRSYWHVDEPAWSPAVLLAWLLVTYLTFNFLTVIRPFPIGWDDLGSYLNRPNLLVSYGYFIHSMASFQWEYLTALGFVLFGFGSPVGATVAMLINWTEGLLAVLVVYLFGRQYLGERRGLLSALLYYSLPLVGHFSYADMKIDNAVFFMGAVSTFALFRGLLPPPMNHDVSEEHSSLPVREKIRWMVLAGVFAGFAFGMKVTAIMVLFALIAVLPGVLLHPTAFLGALSLIIVYLFFNGALNITAIGKRIFGQNVSLETTGVFVVLGVSCLAFSGLALFLGRSRWRMTLLFGLVFVGSFFAAIAPWVYHNNLLRGHIIPKELAFGAPNTTSVQLGVRSQNITSSFGEPVRVLPPELALDPNHPACGATGTREELDRYWGFREGWGHYLSLPWRTVLNIDSAGYYVTTMPALFLFPLLLLLPYFWTRQGRWLRWMAAGTVVLLLEWMFMANGVPWYGIGVFLGLVLGIEAFIARAPDVLNKGVAAFLITIALFSNFAHRFWQFDQQRNLIEYPIGKASAEVMRERTIPHYDDIAEVAVELYKRNPDRPYLYRMGTFIPYFIPRNLEVIGIADHQLDTFNCIHQERDAALTVKRLKALGFSSIIFDTNTATIERDPNGSLHKKVQALVDFLNDPAAGLQLVVNDPDGGVAYLLIP